MTDFRAMDVSSWQPQDITGLIHQHHIQHAIIRIYMPWESVPWDHTVAQVRSARDNGVSIGGYVWAYRNISPEATIKAVITRCAEIGLVLPLLWLDCENYMVNGQIADPGPDADWLSRAVDCAERIYEMACGLYTGAWWVQGHFPGGTDEFAKFSRLPLWIADYDGDPSLDTATVLPGWTSVACKQYTDQPVDLDTIRPEYTVYQSTPAPDKCSEVLAGLDRMIARKPYRRPSRRELIALRGGDPNG